MHSIREGPTILLRSLWQRWRRLGQFIGGIAGHVFLTLFYFTVLVPFAIGLRLASDPLGQRKRPSDKGWAHRQTHDRTLDDASRQY